MSQGYANALLTLQFESYTQNNNGVEALFFYPYQEWDNTARENIDRWFPIKVWIPQAEAGNTVLVMKASQGELLNVDGSFVYEEDKDNGFTPSIRIRANEIFPHKGHKFINKITVINGKCLPKVSKAGKEMFEVWSSNPDKNGQAKYKCKVGVELPTAPNTPVNPATGYVDTKSQWLQIEANFDTKKGSGKSSSLFPWLAGQAVSFAGSLSISGSKGKAYVTIFLSGANHFLSATRPAVRDVNAPKETPVEVKGYKASQPTEIPDDF